MATNFPSSADSFTNPSPSDDMATVSHSSQHTNVNDAVEAIETALLDGAPLHIDDANERVGVGTTSPSVDLEVAGTAKAQDIVASASVTALSLTVDTDVLHVDSTNNRVGIGTTSPAAKLDIEGDPNDLWTTNSWRDSVRIDNGGILRWGIGSTTVHGIGQSGDKLYFGRSTTEDSSSAATTYNMAIDSSGNVGIGTTSPDYKLHVTGGSSNDSTPEFVVDGNGSIAFHNGLGAGSYNGIVQAGDKGIIFTDGTQGTGEFVIAPWASGSGGMRIDSSGKTTFANYVSQPRAFFRAYRRGNQGWSLTGVQTIVFDNTVFNSGNNYSTSNGRFTAPVAGYYHLGAHFFKYTTYSNSTNTYWGIFTSNGYSTTTNHGTAGQDGGQSLNTIVFMGANDYADVQITSAGSTIQSYGTMSFNSFYGYLLSA